MKKIALALVLLCSPAFADVDFIRGDVHPSGGDGQITIGDIVAMTWPPVSPWCEPAWDADGNGLIQRSSDSSYLMAWFMSSGPPPPGPFPD